MKIQINVEKKYFFGILIGILVLVGGFFVYGAVTPSQNPGHDIGQIGGVPICASGQALTLTSSGWSCVTASALSTPPACSSGQVLTWTGSAWSCVSNAVVPTISDWHNFQCSTSGASDTTCDIAPLSSWDVCFLVGVYPRTTNDNNDGCYVYQTATTWRISVAKYSGSGKSMDCYARCLKF